MNEDYVSFEVAKLLKEKGFNVYGDGSFDSGIEVFAEYSPSSTLNKCIDSKPHQKAYPAPTHQMAMKWLREMHGIFIAINNDDLDFNWQCYDLINRGSTLDPKILSESYAGYKTYEDAVEAALRYVLENII